MSATSRTTGHRGKSVVLSHRPVVYHGAARTLNVWLSARAHLYEKTWKANWPAVSVEQKAGTSAPSLARGNRR